MRIKIFNLAIVFIFLFILICIFNLQVIQSKKLNELSDKNCIRLIPQQGARGRIIDSQGNVIAGNYLTYDVMVLPEDKKQTEKALIAVSNATGISLKDLKDSFKKNYTASFIPVRIVENIDIKKAFILGELRSDYNNIVIQPKPLRHYPYGKLASHVIGYLGEIDYWRLAKLEDYGYRARDIVGVGGVEERYDYYLRSEDGAMSVEVDHRGKFVRLLGFKPPVDGKDIQLTLDIRVQKIVEDVFSDVKGSVVIIEPYTGEIIAMVSYPDFSPQSFIDKSGSAMANFSESALVNRAISGVYPPASVFKLVSAAASLETRKINLATTYSCSGSILIGNRQFGCWGVHKDEDLRGAIAHSCDIYFYKIGLLLGAQAIHDYAVKLGLSKLTYVDLPYEVSGFVPSPLWKKIHKFQNWFDGDTANFVIGQGELSVTPIQMARLTAVFANTGMLVKPYIVRRVDNKDISMYQRKNTPVSIKQNVLNYIRNDLKAVVSMPDGTANALSGLSVAVAGKTGTAQAGRNLTHGWFVGFFPFDKPRFVICVFLENRGSGQAAVGLTKLIISRMIEDKLI